MLHNFDSDSILTFSYNMHDCFASSYSSSERSSFLKLLCDCVEWLRAKKNRKKNAKGESNLCKFSWFLKSRRSRRESALCNQWLRWSQMMMMIYQKFSNTHWRKECIRFEIFFALFRGMKMIFYPITPNRVIYSARKGQNRSRAI